MGIKSYYEWLHKNYEYAIKQAIKIQKYDHILIDTNFVLHNAMYNSKTEKDFIVRVYQALDFIFSRFIALHSVYIAIDGPAPYSKIALQRKRRSKIMSDQLERDTISHLCLTSGTALMENLTKHLIHYFQSRRHWFSYRKLRFFISPASESGEGEIKIFSQIKKINEQYPEDNFLVVGNDADLVVLAMACQPVTNLDILIRKDKENKLISLDSLINQHRIRVAHLLYDHHNAIPEIDKIRDDFAVVSMMMGNDYLTKIYYIKAFSLWESYFRTKTCREDYLMDGIKFNKDFLADMMLDLSLSMAPKYRQMKFYKHNKYSNKAVKNYLEGFLWCLQMYRTGQCPMIDYLFEDIIPRPYEVFYYLTLGKKEDPVVPRSEILPVPYYAYTLLVLPRKAKKFIPDKYHSLMDNELDILYRDEECQECLKHRSQLSDLHKKMIILRKNNEDTTEVRQQIGEVSKGLHAHKKDHEKPVSISEMVKMITNSVEAIS